MSEPFASMTSLTSDVIEILNLEVVSFWLGDGLDSDGDEYNSIPEEADGRVFGDDSLFVGIYMPSIVPAPGYGHEYDSPDIWDTGRAVIARRMNGDVIARDMARAKIVDLLVLPWSRRGCVTKERLMEGNVFAPVLGISDWRSVRFVQRFREDISGRQLGLLEIWQQVDRALDAKEAIWICD